METRLRLPAGFALCVVAVSPSWGQTPLGTGFAYQGQLRQNDLPADGTADFQFRLFPSLAGGTQIGTTQAKTAVPVSNGLFATELDFGAAAFNGETRFLEVAVRSPAGSGPFAVLSPRQPLTATPYALQTRGMFVAGDGKIGIGTTNPTRPVEIANGGILFSSIFGDMEFAEVADLTAFATTVNPNANFPALRVHTGSTFPLLFTVLNNGNVGVGTPTPGARLHVLGGADASLSSNGFLQLGDSAAGNVVIDNNEIMARNAGAVSTLFLNNDGGDVRIGGLLDIGLETVAFHLNDEYETSVNCPGGKKPLGGGCFCGLENISSSFPTPTGWYCQCEENTFLENQVQAWAICARVK